MSTKIVQGNRTEATNCSVGHELEKRKLYSKRTAINCNLDIRGMA